MSAAPDEPSDDGGDRNKQKITIQSNKEGEHRAYGNPEEVQLKQRHANGSQPRLHSKITCGDFKKYCCPGPILDQLIQYPW